MMIGCKVKDEMLLFSTLAAPIVALLYFYVLAFAVLLGAELNGTLEQLHPAGRRPKHRYRLARAWQRLRSGGRNRPPEDPEGPGGDAGNGSAPISQAPGRGWRPKADHVHDPHSFFSCS